MILIFMIDSAGIGSPLMALKGVFWLVLNNILLILSHGMFIPFPSLALLRVKLMVLCGDLSLFMGQLMMNLSCTL
jgi:hypothetical protein